MSEPALNKLCELYSRLLDAMMTIQSIYSNDNKEIRRGYDKIDANAPRCVYKLRDSLDRAEEYLNDTLLKVEHAIVMYVMHDYIPEDENHGDN